jgi:signal transduction histidine kinase
MADNEDAVVIADEISRLERIVRDFLEFARPSEPETASVSAQRLLEEVSLLMRPQLEQAGIRLNLAETNGLWLNIDFQQIKQVLINLIRNAAESIDGSGTVTLRAFKAAVPIAGRPTLASVIEVGDTGRGIPPELGRRLFDPFFTTKDGGTGLGHHVQFGAANARRG